MGFWIEVFGLSANQVRVIREVLVAETENQKRKTK
jgi:hypothetical protein